MSHPLFTFFDFQSNGERLLFVKKLEQLPDIVPLKFKTRFLENGIYDELRHSIWKKLFGTECAQMAILAEEFGASNIAIYKQLDTNDKMASMDEMVLPDFET